MNRNHDNSTPPDDVMQPDTPNRDSTLELSSAVPISSATEPPDEKLQSAGTNESDESLATEQQISEDAIGNPIEPETIVTSSIDRQSTGDGPSGHLGIHGTEDITQVLGTCQQIQESLDTLSDSVGQQLAALAPLCERLLMDTDERTEQAKLRDILYEKLDASRAHFQLQLVRPMLLRLTAMFDLLEDMRRMPELPEAAQHAFGLLRDHLCETLTLQGVELVDPQPGDLFDKSLHYVIKAEVTSNAAQHERIAQTVLPGFVYVGAHDRTQEIRPVAVRPARVATWKFEQLSSNEDLTDGTSRN